MRSKISLKKKRPDVAEEACVEEWVNVVRIGPEFGRGGCGGSGAKTGGVPAG